MHRSPASASEVAHKAINPYSATGGKAIFFFVDPPHLMKTTRNCLANTGSHTLSRHLWNEMDISWKHLLQLQDALRHCAQQSGGLSIGYKLKREHFHLTSYSKMRVNLAVQILSRTTSEAFCYYGIQGSAAAQTLLLFMDRFFDMLDVRSKDESVRKRKDDLKPYESADDSRLTWLEDAFLGYFDAWESTVKKRDGFSKSEKALMLLSSETREGLRITVHSFVTVVREFLQHPELKGKYLLSERLNQDPLENLFGKVRQAGGRNINPNVKMMEEATDVLRLQASSTLDVVRNSSRLKKRLFQEKVLETTDTVPLAKRRQKRAKSTS